MPADWARTGACPCVRRRNGHERARAPCVCRRNGHERARAPRPYRDNEPNLGRLGLHCVIHMIRSANPKNKSSLLLAIVAIALLMGCQGAEASNPSLSTPTVPSGDFIDITAPAIRLAPLDSQPHSSTWRPEPPDPVYVPRMLRPISDGRLLLATFPECFYFDHEGNQTDSLRLDMPDRETIEAAELDPLDTARLIDPERCAAVTANADGRVWMLLGDSWRDDPILLEWNPDGTLENLINPAAIELPFMNKADEPFKPFAYLCSDGDQLLLYREGGSQLVLEHGQVTAYCHREGRYGPPEGAVLYDDFIYINYPPERISRSDLEGNFDRSMILVEVRESGGLHGGGVVMSNPYQFGTWGIGVMPDGGRVEFLREEDHAWAYRGGPEEGTEAVFVEFDSEGNEVDRFNYISMTRHEDNPLHPFESIVSHCMNTPDGWLFVTDVEEGIEASAELYDRDLNHVESVEFVPTSTKAPEEPEPDVVTAISGTPAIGATADMSLIGADLHAVPCGYRAIDHSGQLVLTLSSDLEILGLVDISSYIASGTITSADVCRMDSTGRLYILDRTQKKVLVLDPEGNYYGEYRNLNLSGASGPYGAVFGGGFVGSFLDPTGMTVDAQDNLWIYGLASIVVFDSEGELVHEYTIRSPGSTEMDGDTTAIELDADRFRHVIVPTVGESEFFCVVDDLSGWIIVCDRDGVEHGRIDWYDLEGKERTPDSPAADPDLLPLYGTVTWRESERFAIGPDGKFYYFNPSPNYDPPYNGLLVAFNEMGGEIARVEVEDLPGGLWSTHMVSVWIPPGSAMNRVWIDHSNRLVIYVEANKEVLVYPLREDDPLEPHEFALNELLGTDK